MSILKNNHNLGQVLLIALMVLMCSSVLSNSANAHNCPGCTSSCTNKIQQDHEVRLRPDVTEHISLRFTEHRDWLLNTFFTGQVLPALMLFTEQMSAVAMQQTMAIGSFFDAKHQLETQRLFQELQVQAHKDYQPSEDFCYFGTNVRSLSATEQKGRTNAYILSQRQIARQLGQENMGGANDADKDKYARWEQFKGHFCDPKDSNWSSTVPDSGLSALCSSWPSSAQFSNADIDYTRLIENERTISLLGGVGGYDYTDATISQGERAVSALQNNLYGHNIIDRPTKEDLKDPDHQNVYMALRSVAAKRSVAENTFNSIVGMKSAGTTTLPPPSGPSPSVANTGEFLGAIMIELGTPVEEVNDIIGQDPSYYAQLELIAKKIYQSPDFYSNLYDTPANVKRKSVALKAIELMVDRAIYESQVRQEMLSSVLLSARLREPFKEAQRNLGGGAN